MMPHQICFLIGMTWDKALVLVYFALPLIMRQSNGKPKLIGNTNKLHLRAKAMLWSPYWRLISL